MDIKKFDLKQLLTYFSEIGGKRWAITLQLHNLEKLFKPIKDGKEELSLKHILAIRDEWAFANWWKMPQIREEGLVSLRGVFTRLKPKDEIVIGKLFDLLKNIEIVSCILRFIDPQNYGIFSPPVENILNVRGERPLEKYINYLNHLHELQEEYKIVRIADVDMALWALTNIANYSYLRHHPEFSRIFDEYEETPNLVKHISVKNSLEGMKKRRPLYKAELFLDSDPILAGLIAGRELELFVRDLCVSFGIQTMKKSLGKNLGRHLKYISVGELSERLAEELFINKDEKESIDEWWKLSCSLLGEAEMRVSREEVKRMIDGLSKLKEKYHL